MSERGVAREKDDGNQRRMELRRHRDDPSSPVTPTSRGRSTYASVLAHTGLDKKTAARPGQASSWDA